MSGNRQHDDAKDYSAHQPNTSDSEQARPWRGALSDITVTQATPTRVSPVRRESHQAITGLQDSSTRRERPSRPRRPSVRDTFDPPEPHPPPLELDVGGTCRSMSPSRSQDNSSGDASFASRREPTVEDMTEKIKDGLEENKEEDEVSAKQRALEAEVEAEQDAKKKEHERSPLQLAAIGHSRHLHHPDNSEGNYDDAPGGNSPKSTGNSAGRGLRSLHEFHQGPLTPCGNSTIGFEDVFHRPVSPTTITMPLPSRTDPSNQSSIPSRFNESEPDWLAAILRRSTPPLSGSHNGNEREASTPQSRAASSAFPPFSEENKRHDSERGLGPGPTIYDPPPRPIAVNRPPAGHGRGDSSSAPIGPPPDFYFTPRPFPLLDRLANHPSPRKIPLPTSPAVLGPLEDFHYSRAAAQGRPSRDCNPNTNYSPTPWPRRTMRGEARGSRARVQQLLRDAQEAVQQQIGSGSSRLAGFGDGRALGLDEGIERMRRLVGDGEKLRKRTGENLNEVRELFMGAVGRDGSGGEMIEELRQMVGGLESVHERAGRQLTDSRSRLAEAVRWRRDGGLEGVGRGQRATGGKR